MLVYYFIIMLSVYPPPKYSDRVTLPHGSDILIDTQDEHLRRHSKFYLPVYVKFIIALILAVLWGFLSAVLARKWINDLATVVGITLSYLIIYGIAVIPGFMNAFLIACLFMDKRPKFRKNADLPAITILVAAYNEEKHIAATMEGIAQQRYSGRMRVIVINDGSTDNTLQILLKLKYPWLKVLDMQRNVGKANALNEGLKQVNTAITITVDGDSYLFKNALRNLILRYMNDPRETRAVAGAVLVRNSRLNLVTKIQEWDYFHGIAAIKRLQSFFHGTLVAQGAFSAYDTATLKELGGWPHTVGEDIVLTWCILNARHRVGFAENACIFTNVPETWKQFARQRQRWSRGLIEAFKINWRLLFKWRMTTLFIWWNLLFPYMDLVYTLAFIPGLVLACFGVFWIAGPMTLLVLPLAILVNYLMFRIQSRMFVEQGLSVRKNVIGFILYALFYSIVLQPVCVIGYAEEFLRRTKKWGTK
jgi:biofilm PGA synthesis N-glycosyltransferase PgaC